MGSITRVIIFPIGVIPKKNTHLDALAMLCWIRKVDNIQYVIKIDYKKKKSQKSVKVATLGSIKNLGRGKILIFRDTKLVDLEHSGK